MEWNLSPSMMREADIPSTRLAEIGQDEEKRSPLAAERAAFVTSRHAGAADRRQAFAAVAVSSVIFLAAIPFAKVQLAPISAFIPTCQSALVVCDLVTAALLAGQARFSRSAALLVLALGYLFTALLAV